MRINQRLQFEQPKGRTMSAVLVASGYARRLVEGEARRSGWPLKAALRPVARRLRASPGALWSLLFRPPKQISADLLSALEAAVEAELIREIKALEHELATLRATARRPNPRTIAEVEEGLVRLKQALAGDNAP